MAPTNGDENADPYEKHGLDPDRMYAETSPIDGRIVAVMDFRLEDRELELIESPTRVLRTNDVHEVLLVDETDPAPGESTRGVTYVGFVAIERGGLAVVGDEIRSAGGDLIGEIVGFDLTHAPNHLNVAVVGPDRTGSERGLACDDAVTIR